MAAADLLAHDRRSRSGTEVEDAHRRRAVPLHRLSQDRRGGAGGGGRSTRCGDDPMDMRRASMPARHRAIPHPPSAHVCRAWTDGPRSPAPTSSAPTRRPPMRCGCAWCARRMHGRASRSATSMRSSARTPGLVAILTAKDVPGENSLRHLPEPEGPAGAGAGPCALPRRGGAGAGRHARGRRGHVRRGPADRMDAARRRSPASMPRWRPARPRSTPHAPDNVLTRGNLKCGDVAAGHARRGRDRRRPRSRPASSSTPTSSRRRATPCRSARPRSRSTACTQAPYMDREETARVLGVAQSTRAHPADRLRRRLRRQARRVGAAAAGGGGVGDAAPGAHRLHAHRVDGLHHQAPSGAHLGQGLGRRAGPPDRLRDARPTSTPAPTPPGGRRWRAACRCTRMRALQGGERLEPRRAPSTPTIRRPAPSAASACRRRRSRTRR